MQTSSPRTVSASTTGPTTLDRGLFALTLCVTAALSLVLSANKLMWNDEFLSFYSDSVPTARGVVDVQLHHPISLDPPTYHLLSHFAMDAFGRGAMALRLPALCGFLLMEVALFALVRRIAGARSAVIASLFPLMTASFRYSAEGRPYGLLLGLYACAFACWYVASRRENGRALSLVGLAVSMALAITSHYFGVLIAIPVVAAEAARTVARKRLDVPMVGAMVAGCAALAIDLPFAHGLKPYRTHYYISSVSVRAVTQGYRELFVRYTTWPVAAQKVTALVMLVATLALIAAAWKRFLTRPADEPASLWAGLVALAMLPFFGFLLGRFVTHTMEVRYVIAAVLAFAIAIALVLQQRLNNRSFYAGLYVAMMIVVAIGFGVTLRGVRADTRATMASLEPSTAMQDALLKHPDALIYTQSLGDFYLDSYYAPDASVRARFALLYDEPLEVQWLGHNTNAVTAVNMQHYTTFHLVPYTQFLTQPNSLLLDYGSGWEWVGKDLAARGVAQRPLGEAYRGKLLLISPMEASQ